MKFIKKNIINIIIGIIIFIVAVVIVVLFMMEPMSNSSTKVNFMIREGESTTDIINNLADAGLIRSELIAMGYAFISDVVLQAGEYELNKNMSMRHIFDALNLGNVSDSSFVVFYEGDKLTDHVKIIANHIKMDEERVLEDINDPEMIQRLIDSEKYWFLTNDVLNGNIYYALEGYLFPDTYDIYYNASVEEVVVIMLNNTLAKLEAYKDEILSSSMSVHEVLTLASIIERETKYDVDRPMVSEVFLNRIDAGWSLGSDVTTLYGEQKESASNLEYGYSSCLNSYNTRCATYFGLSVGPISNPGIKSIDAALNPTDEGYMYFVADCNGKTYYTNTEAEHIAKTSEIKASGMFCE